MRDDVPSIKFRRDFETDAPIGINLGRITLGPERDDGMPQPTARIVLMPDGVHLVLDTDAEPFVHYHRYSSRESPIAQIRNAVRKAGGD